MYHIHCTMLVFYEIPSLSVPPPPSLLPPELYCDVPLEDGRPVIIRWMVSDVYMYIHVSMYVV